MAGRRGNFWQDLLFIGVPLGVAVAGWFYNAPTWLVVIFVLIVLVAIISLLGDLGVFTGRDPGDY